ncbi:transglutaminase-like domain-containing protein [Syntrophobacter fumaroxidans]|uniref:Transglutaminase domain protein n=1 Tax=Syntrophobacter fumaroxidans (strain DSM 10017 / MPOB) TaxID=335543 RepID=A0LIH5_SYNFM|nr:transglutaminase-like domain-containing protein [Syntrophobacter fumaroxidans]ABK17227.1 transglutaminase domain protein [Syntrophobacter fumaroxidans MPOB]
MMDADPIYLRPTAIIDSDHPSVRDLAEKTVRGCGDPRQMAVRLYLAVRDGIWYSPYLPFEEPLYYRASYVLSCGKSFCIPKASLLCALSRACGIPCRLGFANVRNHLAGERLTDRLGTDVFVYHAFAEFFLGGGWVKATPAFNRELCEWYRVPPLDFNGRDDSLFQAFNSEHQRYMEYIEFIGSYADVPVEEIVNAFVKTYGERRAESWAQRRRDGGCDSGGRPVVEKNSAGDNR